ncbi:MAG: type II toxin-antitoxin system RelE/ParE family toxin [Pseudolabrys sp.]|nr:type II toxin-antitoxin system RelE/ParE family toxin [Pseudolabrys sp.]
MKVVFTEAADADLVTIIEYIAAHHLVAASDLAMLFDGRLKTLADYPLIGRERSNLMPGLAASSPGMTLSFIVCDATGS